MTQAFRARRCAVLLLVGLAGACRKSEAPRAGPPPPPPDPVAAEAEMLGRELFEIVDRATEYRGSHRGRYPASVAQMGIDSLTGTTARRLALTGGALSVTVALRRPDARAISSCTAGADVLEGASLNEGRFPLTCIGRDGGTRVLLVAAGSR